MTRVWLVVGLLFAGCSSKGSQEPEFPRLPGEPEPPARPAPAQQQPLPASSEYAIARRAFKTVLIVSGPAPADWRQQTLRDDAQEIAFQSAELKLSAWITRDATQPASPRRPAVLFLHAGHRFTVIDWDIAKRFRDAGYIVMAPILRAENGQPGHFSRFYDEVDDVLAATEVLAALPSVDASHIYVVGHGVGGTLAMFAAMSSKRFRAAVSMGGYPDVTYFPNAMLPFDRDRKGEVALRSPLSYATSFLCPTRLYFGSDEKVRDSTLETARRADAAGLDVKAHEVEGNEMTMDANAIPLAIAFFKEKQ